MRVDKTYCMNSFLQFRFILDKDRGFKLGNKPHYKELLDRNYVVKDSKDVERAIRVQMNDLDKNSCALMLSSGIDSAILAKYMPKGAKAYTLRCIADSPVIDEADTAAHIAQMCGLEHCIVEVTWDDYQRVMPKLMQNKQAPIHSIEPLIYKACERAKEDGIKTLIFGESADCLFGGLDQLFGRSWTTNEFADRYDFVPVDKVLKEPQRIFEPYELYSANGMVDVQRFMENIFFKESMNSYYNACETGDIEFFAPYSYMKVAVKLDTERIGKGEGKYMIREVFNRLYPNYSIPAKVPMPRAVTEWLKNWEGPHRPEFLPGCHKGLKGDQKWLIYCLEKFLDMIETV